MQDPLAWGVWCEDCISCFLGKTSAIIIMLLFVGCPPVCMGLYYTLSPPLLLVSLQSLPYIFNCKWSFLSTPGVIFMDSHSVNTAILICWWEEVSSGSSYSAILTTTPHGASQWKTFTHLRIDISSFFLSESSQISDFIPIHDCRHLQNHNIWVHLKK